MPHQPRKRFGQHFLRDPNVLYQLQQAIAPQTNDHMVEIGPGEGVLTQLLLPEVKQLDLIEIDRDLVKKLTQEYKNCAHLSIHNTDVLDFNLYDLSQARQSLRIVGNLPYNISSPLLFHLFKQMSLIQDMHFMLQKEVVTRMTATHGDKHYSRLSVMTQYFCQSTQLFDVNPQAFSPPPKVDSAVIRIVPHPSKMLAKDEQLLSTVVRMAFTHRRKTLYNNLKSLLNPADFKSLMIDPGQRPQQLSVLDFVKISNLLYDKNNEVKSQ